MGDEGRRWVDGTDGGLSVTHNTRWVRNGEIIGRGRRREAGSWFQSRGKHTGKLGGCKWLIERSLYSMRSVIFNQCRDRRMAEWQQHVQESFGSVEAGWSETWVGCDRVAVVTASTQSRVGKDMIPSVILLHWRGDRGCTKEQRRRAVSVEWCLQ